MAKLVEIYEKIIDFFMFIYQNILWLYLITRPVRNAENLRCLNGKTAIVTGGNTGLGFYTSMCLASHGAKVIIACRRNAEEARREIVEKTGNPNISVVNIDMCSFASIRRFAAIINEREDKIDILVNNAGISITSEKMTEDGLSPVMQTNYISSFLLTHLLIDKLKAADGARVVFVASGSILINELNIDDLSKLNDDANPTAVLQIYASSKHFNVFAGQEFAKKLGKYGIIVNVADPGISYTKIVDEAIVNTKSSTIGGFFTYIFLWIIFNYLAKSAYHAQQTIFHLAANEKFDNCTSGGKLYVSCRRISTLSKRLKNAEFCENAWKVSEKLAKLTPEEMIQ